MGHPDHLYPLSPGLGRPHDALPAAGQAVAIYRELAEAIPDRYRPDLARSLHNLGVRLSELGRPHDALPATEQAVAIYRELAEANPDRYRPDLARSLHNLGVRLSELGRFMDHAGVERGPSLEGRLAAVSVIETLR